ncbi:RHS repeat protein [Paraburkholderia tropica]|uniref:RHS repeat protein n=1 Tax=Paraburkholderia tropica TaxID=92647 RepID=UPI001601DBB3|nr:RHS repeat protein [Paraburkholderia tropica]QNB14655.1 RHS repeat protein [Paraburkholderia tropica]
MERTEKIEVPICDDGAGGLTVKIAKGNHLSLSQRLAPHPRAVRMYSLMGTLSRDGKPVRCTNFIQGVSLRIDCPSVPSYLVDGRRSASLYDELGNVTECLFPYGQRLATLYYGSGHTHQINFDGETLSDFERDAAHREVQRTQGPRVCQTTYDYRGRTASRLSELSARTGTSGNAALGATYQYDRTGNLYEVALQGGRQSRHAVQYAYDSMGRMTGTGAERELSVRRRRQPDRRDARQRCQRDAG